MTTWGMTILERWDERYELGTWWICADRASMITYTTWRRLRCHLAAEYSDGLAIVDHE